MMTSSLPPEGCAAQGDGAPDRKAVAGFDALVLAGSRLREDTLALFPGYRHKALIEIGGKAMLVRVLEAVRGAGARRIAVSCDEPEVMAIAGAFGAEITPTARHPTTSVLAALDRLDFPVLVTTGDHALLESEWIEQLIRECPQDADFCAMAAKRETIEAALPDSRRTYAHFADGQWSGCNLYLLRTPDAARMVALWRQVERHRKQPWKIAARLGPGNLVAYLLGRLTLAGALERVGRRVAVKAALVPAGDGLAAVDVDKPADLAQVRAILAARSADLKPAGSG